MLSKQTLSSKITVALLVVMLLFLGRLKFKQWQSQNKVEQEKLNLQKQTDELTKSNEELSKTLQYLKSPDFTERVAREQLALKKDGEQVFSFSVKQPAETANQEAETPLSNLEKWWAYFFKN